MDRITISDLEVFAYHGVLKEENSLGQKFLISAELYMDVSEAAKDDDISKSINYANICKEIDTFLKNHTFKLIETMADRLAKHLLILYKNLDEICIKIKKPWAPILMTLDTVSVTVNRKWHNVYLSLGSNMGDMEDNINKAIILLDKEEDCHLIRVSTLRLTKPVGPVKQNDFLNGALYMKTLKNPYELLALIGSIENELKRVREIHWGPRTIDLDILLYDDQIIQSEELIIPHVEMDKRLFVLEPMAELAPWLRHPVLGVTMRELLGTWYHNPV
ncbi:MAG: 2-amino-4-hydroxy-6-hydroxymethyldihydropteridine diphosphokinase [Clostridiales bacterium]|jgi:dihydroneopterin aldolase/2-amino-4-hydroxy-6-hydroxymethyldihydropteridine diphosphokinase|nr:2-amino-4-hydroxy-6-hydroxymethyldihydropteridine diphosphokinase [Clostridiales bacterium]